MRLRDSQRKKFFKANVEVSEKTPKVDSVKDAERFIKRIMKSKWWADRFGDIVELDVSQSKRWTYSYRLRKNIDDRFMMSITFFQGSIYQMEVLKIVAHITTKRQNFAANKILKRMGTSGVNWPLHGWKFCENYLALVSRFMGRKWHDELKAEFKKNKVRFRPKRVRIISPEAAERLRQNLKKYRESNK